MTDAVKNALTILENAQDARALEVTGIALNRRQVLQEMQKRLNNVKATERIVIVVGTIKST